MPEIDTREAGVAVMSANDDPKPAARHVRISITDDAKDDTEPLQKSSSLPTELEGTDYTVKSPSKAKNHHNSDHHVHFNENLPLEKPSCKRADLKNNRAHSLPSDAFKNLAIDKELEGRRKTTPRSESLKELSLPHHEHFVFDDDSDIFVKQADDVLDPRPKSSPICSSSSVDSIPEEGDEEENGDT
uniref:Uncharacterized protein n=1 Tax=Helicotheca tamesis TaxID=374047 RepID=A0A7S2HBU0_9STRA|mmetsp:Transcript_1686/g.2445  ORF Transcript_1686/g.2445 Transcript_1686/m.2445 type:complete len:187 (+) Transcript_1686:68-628(+)|eukprot:CAMPEP_0185729958 /NCGR_PEP_ID=MMETSP1171-20130828/7830_1 /TAXON_ID=374046 /ORGANISM="Helicotheca tamensis, Strain CCMP826" /LENGTH=186 /DNA_ID=CAMNT_0028398911 /DNA_START=31 /DNA_END=591 /DNA_ORIENTATION=-